MLLQYFTMRTDTHGVNLKTNDYGWRGMLHSFTKMVREAESIASRGSCLGESNLLAEIERDFKTSGYAKLAAMMEKQRFLWTKFVIQFLQFVVFNWIYEDEKNSRSSEKRYVFFTEETKHTSVWYGLQNCTSNESHDNFLRKIPLNNRMKLISEFSENNYGFLSTWKGFRNGVLLSRFVEHCRETKYSLIAVS